MAVIWRPEIVKLQVPDSEGLLVFPVPTVILIVTVLFCAPDAAGPDEVASEDES